MTIKLDKRSSHGGYSLIRAWNGQLSSVKSKLVSQFSFLPKFSSSWRNKLTVCLICLNFIATVMCLANTSPIIVTGGGVALQTAIANAPDGSTIHVHPGTYTPIWTQGRTLYIKAIEGPDETIIDGNNTNRCATLSEYASYNGTASTNTVLDGFCLINGYTDWFDENHAEVDCYAGGVYGGIVMNGVIKNCSAFVAGGAMHAILRNLIITRCRASNICGGASECDLENCLVYANCGDWANGGLSRCFAVNCTVVSNRAGTEDHQLGMIMDEAGCYWNPPGASCGVSGGIMRNCIIWGNIAKTYREEYYWDEDTQSWKTIKIIFDVLANYDCCMLEKCFTLPAVPKDSWHIMEEHYTGWNPTRNIPCQFEPGPNTNNSAPPSFMAADDFRLRFDSPCIDTGKAASLWCDADLVGNNRFVGNSIDIGCYEFQRKIDIQPGGAETSVIASVPMDFFDNDAKPILLANNGNYEAAALATAANNLNPVWECYVAGISPTNATEYFRTLIAISNGAPVITWTPNLNTNGEVRVYTVMGKTNLTDAAWICPTNSSHRFYKVKVEMP